jgi:CBS domain-containing protein
MVMSQPVAGVSPSMPFEAALEQLRLSRLPALPVVNPDRVVVGLITTDNISDLLLIRRHLTRPA